MKRKLLLLPFFILSAKLSLGQDANYNNLAVNNFTKYYGYNGIFGWGIANDNTTDPRPYWRSDAQPYMINHHTGLTLSAHSLYGGIRFYNQGYPNPYDPATGAKLVMSIVNGNVGIGTTNPTVGLLQIAAVDQANQSAIAVRQSNNAAFGFDFALDQAVNGVGYWYGISNNTRTSLMQFDRITNCVSFPNGNIGIGTVNPDQKLSVAGTIHSQSVKVDMTGWSDYVFNPTYNLPSLVRLSTFINKNHHLPGIPSEEEIVKNGIDVGEMLKQQEQKIEELTLYLIEKNKELESVKKDINRLKRKNH